MRVLCCLDGENAEQISRAVETLLRGETGALAAFYVTDNAPEVQMEEQRLRRWRASHPPLPRRERMRQAEELAGQEILAEGSRYLAGAETIQRTGRPEREIVRLALEWQADVIVICSRSRSIQGSEPPSGPKSVGHVARFVLDHAPCPVLLVRPRSGSPDSLL